MRAGAGFGMSAMVAGVALLCAPAAVAQEHVDHSAHQAKATCDTPAELPAEMAGWSGTPVAVKAATVPGKISAATLTAGQRAEVALAPTPKVAFPLRPEKPGGSVSKSGLVRFVTEQAGVYRVALGAGAWVDVIEQGKALPSIAHGHGPECSGIRKMVDYDVQPGTHILQIAGSADAVLDVMVVRLR